VIGGLRGAAASKNGLVVLSAVERTYQGIPPVHALRSANLSIGREDYVSLSGRSGSGKSTLLNLIGLLDKPTAGSIMFNGIDTSVITDRQASVLRSKNIGFVFQSFNLLPNRTASENIALALLYQKVPKSSRMILAQRALDRVGVLDRAGAFPGQLSGGEKQRVAIARAVAGQPALLLCDEPTGNLDTSTTRNVLDLLDSLHEEGIAVVIVTHDFEVAERARRHFVMTDGVISEQPLMTRHEPQDHDGSNSCAQGRPQ